MMNERSPPPWLELELELELEAGAARGALTLLPLVLNTHSKRHATHKERSHTVRRDGARRWPGLAPIHYDEA